MYAHKTTITVPESRHVELDLPRDIPAGEAELIVLVARPRATGPAAGSREALHAGDAVVEAWRQANHDKLLSSEQIDAYTAEERASWDDR
jgi:hypothetical protein